MKRNKSVNGLTNNELFTVIKLLSPEIYDIYYASHNYPEVNNAKWIYKDDNSKIWMFDKTIYDESFKKGTRFTYVFYEENNPSNKLAIKTINFVDEKYINDITELEKIELYAFYKLFKPYEII